ncbi:MAG: hypothetical protein CL844_09255 [Crocinitomicaceae bacterium]|nr:hypothetical protein [Crocinitomicaceae bacterium]|tara:strand:+ start:11599 stop:12723 length:1125 start_codon:yes stop_codon:yes gene_type:complete
MSTIEDLIGELLLKQSCVIIPSFGGFVSKKIPARIDYDSMKIFPPSKELLFNKQLINNDGLLINEYSSVNNIPFDLASFEVKSKVKEWQEKLRKKQRIEIKKVGYLYLNSEEKICFEQDRFFNLLLESYGLESIKFFIEEEAKVEVLKETKTSPTPIFSIQDSNSKSKEKEEKEDRVINLDTKEKSNKKVWKYIAAACFLPIAFYSFWIPTQTQVLQSGMISFNDFNPFYKSEAPSYQSQEIVFNKRDILDPRLLEEKAKEISNEVEVYHYNYDNEIIIPVLLDKESSKQTSSTSEAKNIDRTKEMYFIVGCFRNESNAVNLVSKLKSLGMEGRIVDVHNGLSRVSSGSSSSKAEILKIRIKSKELGFKGWVLK